MMRAGKGRLSMHNQNGKDNSKASDLPAWAREMDEILRAGATSQFVLHGNVFDLVPETGDGDVDWVSLPGFLAGSMLAGFDVVLHYDRSKGIRVPTGGDHFFRFLKGMDAFLGTSLASTLPRGKDRLAALDSRNQLPREPKRALELIDRFLIGARGRTRMVNGKRVAAPLKVGVILDYAQFIAPQGDPLYISDLSQTLIQVLHWGSDPGMRASSTVTVLITENLNDLNRALIESPYSAKIRVTLPESAEIRAFVDDEVRDEGEFDAACEVSREALADKLVGLSRASIRALLRRALKGGEKITTAYLTRTKKELIEKEAAGRLEFIESSRTLDDVAGHDEAKAWLRQDAVLLRRARTRALPMGYLLAGRIGTGKTYLVECLAGEIGIPCVELRNFREKWVGATEGNLEKIFSILHALGQVIVFVDEADQMTGKRGGGDGDSGLSGRVYAMLAKEMSDTANRGKIIWIFATSRPDLLEVDLKRQGRLDVHIPLFPPGDPEARAALFAAMARKLRMPIAPEDLPRLPDNDQIGGNEMEGILVRALRTFETARDVEERGETAGKNAPASPEAASATAEAPSLRTCIEDAIADFRPSAHVERLQLMDLLAVKECTDLRFLPKRFRSLNPPEISERILRLKAAIGE
jgi:Arc/MetJ-type ribon-helix-helix transcriptional regulator